MFSEYRTLFPITSQKIYLNHAAISPLSMRVTDKLDEFIDQRSFGSIDIFEQADAIRNRTRVMLARMINTDPEQIAFIQNTSEGFNHLVNGLSWNPGDEIILTDYEFPSNVYPFLNLEKRFGVKVKFVANRDGQIFIEDVQKLITLRTRLLSISFVEFSNGFRNDLEAIGKICHQNNILFSVDSIQGLGAIPLDVKKCQIDFLSNGGHKWLMGLMGAGFMYIAPHLLPRLTPAYTGWLGVENAWDFSEYALDLLPDARRYEYATANFLGITALSESVALLLEAGISDIEKHLFSLGKQLILALEDLDMQFKGSADSKSWSGIFSFSGNKTAELYEYLISKGIIVSLRNGMIRIAPHFYNTRDEIDVLVTEIKNFLSISRAEHGNPIF